MVNERFGFVDHGLLQQIVVLGVERFIGRRGINLAQPQPLPAKIANEPFGARIGQHPIDLFSEYLGLVQFFPFGEMEQLFIGDAFPEKIRQPRCDRKVVQLSRFGSHE